MSGATGICIDLAENAGYGFDKMFDGWKSYYKVEPITENQITHYRIDFPLKTKWENVPENRLNSIIESMKKKNTITIPEISILLKVTEKTIKRDIEKLRELNKIKRVGPDKGGHWGLKITC